MCSTTEIPRETEFQCIVYLHIDVLSKDNSVVSYTFWPGVTERVKMLHFLINDWMPAR